MEVRNNPSPQHGQVENPQATGLSPDAPRGASVDRFGQGAQADANGRPVVWSGSIGDAMTPERRQSVTDNAPSSGKAAGGQR